MQLLRINNHDYTPYLALNGLHVAPQVLLSLSFPISSHCSPIPNQPPCLAR